MRGRLHSALHTAGLILLVSSHSRKSAPRTEARRPPSLCLAHCGAGSLGALDAQVQGISTTDRGQEATFTLPCALWLVPSAPLTLRLPGIRARTEARRPPSLCPAHCGAGSLGALDSLRLRESAPRTEAGRLPPLLSLTSWVASPSRNSPHSEQPVGTCELSYTWDLKPTPFIPTPP